MPVGSPAGRAARWPGPQPAGPCPRLRRHELAQPADRRRPHQHVRGLDRALFGLFGPLVRPVSAPRSARSARVSAAVSSSVSRVSAAVCSGEPSAECSSARSGARSAAARPHRRDHHQGTAVIARLGPPTEPTRPHSHRIGRQAGPAPACARSATPAQIRPVRSGDLRPYVRANVRLWAYWRPPGIFGRPTGRDRAAPSRNWPKNGSVPRFSRFRRALGLATSLDGPPGQQETRPRVAFEQVPPPDIAAQHVERAMPRTPRPS